MTTKHTVTINGKTVSRRSPRPYEFAIVGIRDYAVDLRRAQAVDERQERRNFDWSAGGWRQFTTWSPAERAERETRETATQAQGFEAYLAEVRANKLTALAARQASGEFTRPVVLGWSMSRVNAEKMARQYERHGYIGVMLVPVGGSYTQAR